MGVFGSVAIAPQVYAQAAAPQATMPPALQAAVASGNGQAIQQAMNT
uniref:Uncharacterized protein n=1 Tax=Magnetospirillum gryphiswaldense TaxID=55518 RepID=A4TX94_9PROT|nr:hypothetical protein MGR_3512 [Magnetospirillum gryphiswaldense MSR-1]